MDRSDILLSYEYEEINDEIRHMMKMIYEKILNPIFNNNKELLSEYLQVNARAVTGWYYDKLWGMCRGERNSGKGVLIDLFKKTFEGYIGTFDTSNLLNDFQSGDQAKNNGWLMAFSKKRVLFGSEIQMKEGRYLNGATIKQIASGGDIIRARALFQNETEMKIRAFMWICCNDMPDIKISDAYEKLLYFEYPCSFSEYKSSFAINKEPDPNIKLWIEQNKKIKIAFFHIIKEHYIKEKQVYKILKENTKQFMMDSDTNDDEKIKGLFIFTKDENDSISCKKIQEIIKENGITISNNKLKQRLEGWGAKNYKSNGSRYKNIKKNEN
jgi:hypothetical protein